ncbi:DUF6924 domain-containing protein [Streptomyces sp. NPDC056638]|uniref:DUF6924 domain-containing protein n=1 Tax=Streptomyces sp. NPDC056638 TaxID=3345887 RepID=UPI00369C4F64
MGAVAGEHDAAFVGCSAGYYQELIDSPPPREFRTAPAAVHDVEVNLSIANMDFEELAEAASDDPTGVLRLQ